MEAPCVSGARVCVLQGSLRLRVNKRRGCCYGTDPQHVLEQALPQAVTSHTSFPALSAVAPLLPSAGNKCCPSWDCGREKSPILYADFHRILFFTSHLSCYPSFVASLSPGPLLGFMRKTGSLRGCNRLHV